MNILMYCWAPKGFETPPGFESEYPEAPPRDPYEALAEAVILQGVSDYRRALRKQKKDPGNVSAKIPIEEAEQFFRSDWYRILTTVDGETLIKQLREEVTYDDA